MHGPMRRAIFFASALSYGWESGGKRPFCERRCRGTNRSGVTVAYTTSPPSPSPSATSEPTQLRSARKELATRAHLECGNTVGRRGRGERDHYPQAPAGIAFPARGTARGRVWGARDVCRLEDVMVIGATCIEYGAWIDNQGSAEKTKQLDYGAWSYLAQSNCCLNSLPSFDFSIHHSSHHHEHPAH